MTAISVTIWHNVRTDCAGRRPALLYGYTAGDPMVCVYACQIQARGRGVPEVAEMIFRALSLPAIYAGSSEAADLREDYRQHGLRRMEVGDMAQVGGTALAMGWHGWEPAPPEAINEVRTTRPGTHPLPTPHAR